MAPIDYIPRTREMYADYPAYRWVVNEDVPWAPLVKPLAGCKLALATSGGVYQVGQAPFHTRDDSSYREIPKDTPMSELRISHFSYRTEDAKRDPNCVFPLERLRELEAEGGHRRACRPNLQLHGRHLLREEGQRRADAPLSGSPAGRPGGPPLAGADLTCVPSVRGTDREGSGGSGHPHHLHDLGPGHHLGREATPVGLRQLPPGTPDGEAQRPRTPARHPSGRLSRAGDHDQSGRDRYAALRLERERPQLGGPGVPPRLLATVYQDRIGLGAGGEGLRYEQQLAGGDAPLQLAVGFSSVGEVKGPMRTFISPDPTQPSTSPAPPDQLLPGRRIVPERGPGQVPGAQSPRLYGRDRAVWPHRKARDSPGR